MAGTIDGALSTRHNSLNFLRLILASAVIVWHTYPLHGVTPGWDGRWVGDTAVNGFFALSGYLIAGSRMRMGFWSYLWKRVMRIYPGFWVVLLITAFVLAPLSTLLTDGSWTVAAAVRYLTENVTLRIGAYDIGTTLNGVPYPDVWNGSLWTLMYEFSAYLLIGGGLCIPWLRRHLAITAGAALMLMSASSVFGLAPNGPAPLDQEGVRLWSFFAAGALVYALRHRVQLHPLVGVLSGAAVLALWAFDLSWLSPIPLAVLLLWAGAVLPIRIGVKNDISYGVYIYAFPVQQLLIILIGAAVPLWAFMVVALAATVPLAWLSWRLVERPSMRLKTPFGRRRQCPHTSAVTFDPSPLPSPRSGKHAT